MFLMIRLELGVPGRKITKVKFPFSSYTKDIYYLISDKVDFYHMARVVFVRFFYFSFCPTPSFFLYCVVDWKEVTLHSPHLKNEELCGPSSGAECIIYLEFFCTDFSLSYIYEYIQPYFIPGIHGYLFYTLCYKPL